MIEAKHKHHYYTVNFGVYCMYILNCNGSFPKLTGKYENSNELDVEKDVQCGQCHVV